MEEEKQQTIEDALQEEIGKATGHWQEIDVAVEMFRKAADDLYGTDQIMAHMNMARGMIVPAIELQRKVLEYMASVMDLLHEAGHERARRARREVDGDCKAGFEKGLAEGRKKGMEEVDKWVNERQADFCALKQWAVAHGWKEGMDGDGTAKDGRGKAKTTEGKGK